MAIHEVTFDEYLDVFAVTEMWHRASDDISLSLAAPPGYTTIDAVHQSDPSHGGIVLFHRNTCTSAKIDLPRLTTFEGLCVRTAVNGEQFISLKIY